MRKKVTEAVLTTCFFYYYYNEAYVSIYVGLNDNILILYTILSLEVFFYFFFNSTHQINVKL